jgi:hypothetical protein
MRSDVPAGGGARESKNAAVKKGRSAVAELVAINITNRYREVIFIGAVPVTPCGGRVAV